MPREIREELLRRLDRDEPAVSLAAFVEATTNHKLDVWQHDLCARLEALADTKGRRILIHAAPQHGKSIIVSQRFPAWLLARNPTRRVKLACYNVTHATRFGRIVRDLMQSEEYIRLFPDPRLRIPAITSAEEWSTAARLRERDSQPSFKALGLATGFVGQGSDCFPAETKIKTEIGDIDIRTLTLLECKPQVLAYNHLTGEVVLRRIQATREIYANELIEVTTALGRKFKCTPDHRIFVGGRGYIAASRLTPGDRLAATRTANLPKMQPVQERRQQSVPKVSSSLTMGTGKHDVCILQQVLSNPTIRSSEMAQKGLQGFVLFAAVFAVASRCQECREVQTMRQAQTTLILVLLGCLQSRIQTQLEDSQQSANQLRALLSILQAVVVKDSILFSEVCGHCTLNSDARQGEFALQGRIKLCQVVCGNASIGYGARRLAMRGLQRAGACNADCLERAEGQSHKPSRTPYQPRSARQHAGQSDYSLQEVSLQTPQVEFDSVAVVRRIRSGQVSVYDIQVEGCRNFFAEGVLVHNCLIIDDPYASPEEAYSQVINAKVHSFWTDTAKPRLNDNTNVVVMFHRYCEPDIAGFLMETEPEEWELWRYAAEADGDYVHPITGRGYLDPMAGKRDEGDFLSPRYSREWYEKQRANGYVWLSQFQGRPSAKEGSFFKVLNLEIIPAAPANLKTVRAWDLAASTKGDYTVGAKLGRADAGLFYVLDVVRGQWTPDERNRVMPQTAALDGRSTRIRLAQDPGAAGVDQVHALTRMLAGYSVRSERESGSKEVRADGFASQVNAGNVKLIRGDWNRDFIEELRTFPLGKHDDQIDSAANSFNELAQQQIIGVLKW